jgi:hypothetical protein
VFLERERLLQHFHLVVGAAAQVDILAIEFLAGLDSPPAALPSSATRSSRC